jgi:flagellar biosynthesis anti-sigma factor FlgM
MSVKKTNSTPTPPLATPPSAAKTEGAGKSSRVSSAASAYLKQAERPTTENAASVSISPKAREMSLARKIVDETPDIREDKVAEFKQKLANGTYKPDAEKIAAGILNEAIKDELSKTPEIALE